MCETNTCNCLWYIAVRLAFLMASCPALPRLALDFDVTPATAPSVPPHVARYVYGPYGTLIWQRKYPLWAREARTIANPPTHTHRWEWVTYVAWQRPRISFKWFAEYNKRKTTLAHSSSALPSSPFFITHFCLHNFEKSSKLSMRINIEWVHEIDCWTASVTLVTYICIDREFPAFRLSLNLKHICSSTGKLWLQFIYSI